MSLVCLKWRRDGEGESDMFPFPLCPPPQSPVRNNPPLCPAACDQPGYRGSSLQFTATERALAIDTEREGGRHWQSDGRGRGSEWEGRQALLWSGRSRGAEPREQRGKARPHLPHTSNQPQRGLSRRNRPSPKRAFGRRAEDIFSQPTSSDKMASNSLEWQYSPGGWQAVLPKRAMSAWSAFLSCCGILGGLRHLLGIPAARCEGLDFVVVSSLLQRCIWVFQWSSIEILSQRVCLGPALCGNLAQFYSIP
ncbi:uncharacterized protein LOC122558739 [Chiloscyllium plagiosum]|uniref:uncharacterized protein LOC122558739 n=1 Tax=Chiloscyllium plagiosum TaxID=36176 RepID=UPI001CB87395|nr:uncharacterized protein LOC122558739 [Chiloscyllium plagiosum]